jgi:hypothetical protein
MTVVAARQSQGIDGPPLETSMVGLKKKNPVKATAANGSSLDSPATPTATPNQLPQAPPVINGVTAQAMLYNVPTLKVNGKWQTSPEELPEGQLPTGLPAQWLKANPKGAAALTGIPLFRDPALQNQQLSPEIEDQRPGQPQAVDLSALTIPMKR